MKKHFSKLFLVGAIPLFFFGCTLEEPMMGNFCGVDDNFKGDGPAYIQLDNEKRCYPKDCDSPDSCCDIKNKQMSKFAYQAFKYKRCPADSSFSECRTDGVQSYCAKPENVVVVTMTVTCQTADDCIELNPSITKAECESGLCKVLACEKGTHIDKDKNYCKVDSNDYCGEKAIQCDTANGENCINGECQSIKQCEKDEDCLKNYRFYTEAECVDFTCKAKSCKKGMHVYENECEIDDEIHCGDTLATCDTQNDEICLHGECRKYQQCDTDESCLKFNPYYKEAKCDEGTCVVVSCVDNMHVFETYCELDTNEHCGVKRQACDVNNGYTCQNGECSSNHQEDEILCDGKYINPKEDINYCGAKDDCTVDSRGTDCTKLKYVSDTECIESVCEIKKCSEGYANCNQDVNDGCETNINNNTSNCGACGHKCSTPINAINPICEKSKCSFVCKDNYSACNDGCFNFTNDAEHCGNCYTKCTKLDGGPENPCQNGTCKLCDDGYTVCQNAYCANLQEDVDNCGECGFQCDKNIQNCSNGKCVLKNNIICESGGKLKVNINTSNGMETVEATCVNTVDDFCNMLDKGVGVYVQIKNLTFDYNYQCRHAAVSEPSEPTEKPSIIYLGNDKTITAENVQNLSPYSTLFPSLQDNSVIENLTLNITLDTNSTEAVGALTSTASNSIIRNVSSNSNITAMNATTIGGLIGAVDNKTQVINCSTSGSIEGNENIGGLVGSVSMLSEITNSSSDLTIQANANVGGLIGNLSDSTVENCQVNNTKISKNAKRSYVSGNSGGLIGRISGEYASIRRSQARGSIRCTKICGGLIGRIDSGKVSDTESTVKIEVPEEMPVIVGGLIGSSENGEIYRSKALFNSLTTNSTDCNTGGFVGFAYNTIIDGGEVRGNLKSMGEHSVVGGLVARASKSLILHSKYSGQISTGEVSEQIVGGLVGIAEARTLLGNNFVQADMTCYVDDDASTICGGFVGQAVDYSFLFGNYIFNNTILMFQDNPVDYQFIVDKKLVIGGFIGRIENSLLQNNYSINIGLPFFAGFGGKYIKSFANYWYIDGNCPSIICHLGVIEGELEYSSPMISELPLLMSINFDAPLQEVMMYDYDKNRDKFMSNIMDMWSEMTIKPEIYNFIEASCFMKFDDGKEYIIPVLPGLMPEKCTPYNQVGNE